MSEHIGWEELAVMVKEDQQEEPEEEEEENHTLPSELLYIVQ